MKTVEHENTNKDNKNRKLILLLLLLLLLLLISICVIFWSLFFRAPDVVLNPDYAPEEMEHNQIPIPGDIGEAVQNKGGGGSVSLNYAAQVIIDLSDKKAILYFANPGKSNQDMVIQVVIQDEVLVQSGRLTAGHQLTELDLLPDAAKKLAPGGYDGKFILYYYHPETMEKAMVNTEIEITVSVQE